jgi:hypothetical protein
MDAGTTERHDSEPTRESVLERRRNAIQRTRGVVAGLAPDRCLSEELIAERREEARRAGGVPASAA